MARDWRDPLLNRCITSRCTGAGHVRFSCLPKSFRPPPELYVRPTVKYKTILVYDGGMDWVTSYKLPFKMTHKLMAEINGIELGWAHIEMGIIDVAPGMFDTLADMVVELKKSVHGHKSRYELRFIPIDDDGRHGILLEALYARAGVNSVLFLTKESA